MCLHAVGLWALLDENREEDLSRLYTLLAYVNALDPLRKQFHAYIKVGWSVVAFCGPHMLIITLWSVCRTSAPSA